MRTRRNLILVTGAPRSATTIVGDILGLAPGAGSLYEPMNFHAGDKCIERYFEIPGQGGFSEELFDDLVNRISRLDLRLKPGVWPEDRGLRRVWKHLIGGRSRISLLKLKLTHGLENIVWKDPIAALAAERAARVHNIHVVVTLRSPFAIAASFKRMNWAFDLAEILPRAEAASLRLPEGFSKQHFSNTVTNAAILWELIYGNLLRLAKTEQNVTVVNTNRLIASPYTTYDYLFKRVGLKLGSRARKGIKRAYAERHSGVDRPIGRAHTTHRTISSTNSYWKTLLTEKEVELIATMTSYDVEDDERFE